jgi:hypothetical protein
VQPTPENSHAIVMSVDDPTFGVGALTRDTAQGLDFLDLTLFTGRSFNVVAGQFGAGGDFEGFRHATSPEVYTLINNFGFSPGATDGVTNGNTGCDQLSGLLALLGVTSTAAILADQSLGLTSTILFSGHRRVNLVDFLDSNTNDRVATGGVGFPDIISSTVGHYLVGGSPAAAAPIPEPTTFILFGTGILGLLGWQSRRRMTKGM